MTLQDILDLLNAGGTVAALLVIIGGFLTKRIVPGWVYHDTIRREQEWRTLALQTAHLGHRTASAAEELVVAVREPPAR